MFEASRRSGRPSWVLAAVAVVAVGLVGGALAWNRAHPPPPAPPPAPPVPRPLAIGTDPIGRKMHENPKVKACFANRKRPANEDPKQTVDFTFGSTVNKIFDPTSVVVSAGPGESGLESCLLTATQGMQFLPPTATKDYGWETQLRAFDQK